MVIAVVPLAVFWPCNEGDTDTDGVSECDAVSDVDTDEELSKEPVPCASVEETVELTITVSDCVMRALSEALSKEVIDGDGIVENDGVKTDVVLCVVDTDTDTDTIKEVVAVTLAVIVGGSVDEGTTLLLVVSETVVEVSEEPDIVAEIEAVVNRENDSNAVVDIIIESLGINDGEGKIEAEL
jgi:hypothetical protein